MEGWLSHAIAHFHCRCSVNRQERVAQVSPEDTLVRMMLGGGLHTFEHVWDSGVDDISANESIHNPRCSVAVAVGVDGVGHLVIRGVVGEQSPRLGNDAR